MSKRFSNNDIPQLQSPDLRISKEVILWDEKGLLELGFYDHDAESWITTGTNFYPYKDGCVVEFKWMYGPVGFNS